MVLKNLVLLASALVAPITASPLWHPSLPQELPIRIVEGTSPDPDAIELSVARNVVQLIQKRLGKDKTTAVVQSDVDAADAFWHKLLAANPQGHVSAVTRIRGYAPRSVFNSTSILSWFNSVDGAAFPNAFQDTSPEHWVAIAGEKATGDPQVSTITIESWGSGPTTWFESVYAPRPAFLPALPEFLKENQRALQMELKDGTVMGQSLVAARDFRELGQDVVELYQGVWVPDNTPKDVVAGLEAHITHEFANWMRFAYKRALSLAHA
ncbi:hypothetical protein F5Y17DRAFT_258933 [Xylariaceae sp. FL0594]|nr:hypothetical protein F5Y17DRAFT_258933 [Xylariaceae sp. FL0594]